MARTPRIPRLKFPPEFDLSEEDAAQFDEVCDGVGSLFERLGTEPDDFTIHEKCFSGCVVAVFIRNYTRIRPKNVESIWGEIQDLLRRQERYWEVHVIVQRPDRPLAKTDAALWLAITKYGVTPYLGRVEKQLFDSLESFYQHYWPNSATADREPT
jgi:hypothetical protein